MICIWQALSRPQAS